MKTFPRETFYIVIRLYTASCVCAVWREEKGKGKQNVYSKQFRSSILYTHTFPSPLHVAPPSPLQRHRTDSQDGSLHGRTGLASRPNRRGQSDPKDKRGRLLPQEHQLLWSPWFYLGTWCSHTGVLWDYYPNKEYVVMSSFVLAVCVCVCVCVCHVLSWVWCSHKNFLKVQSLYLCQ